MSSEYAVLVSYSNSYSPEDPPEHPHSPLKMALSTRPAFIACGTLYAVHGGEPITK